MQLISFIIPVFNESESIAKFYYEIFSACQDLTCDYEIYFIDDGSTDQTKHILKSLATENSHIKVICLRRNFGKSVALSVGFKKAVGDIIFTMDADLQDDPKEISLFLEAINEDVDLVCGWKKKRKDPLEKKIASFFFNSIVSMVTGLKLHDFNCGFKAYRRNVIETTQMCGEFHRFIPALVQSYGFKIKEIPIHHRKRQFGKSKYGASRYLAGLFDFLSVVFVIGYSRRPMHFLGRISLISFLIGSGLLTYVFCMKFLFGQTGNRPSLAISIFFLGFAVHVILFGIIADFILYSNHKNTFKINDFVDETYDS